MASRKQDLAKRTADRLAAADTLDQICANVANGGSLVSLCEVWEVRYSAIIAWIYADPGRQARYEAALQARSEWEVERILGELRTIGLADIRQAFDERGRLKPVHELPEEIARALASVETDELRKGRGVTRKVRFLDKIRALELIGRKLNLFIDRHEHTGPSGGPIEIVTAVTEEKRDGATD